MNQTTEQTHSIGIDENNLVLTRNGKKVICNKAPLPYGVQGQIGGVTYKNVFCGDWCGLFHFAVRKSSDTTEVPVAVVNCGCKPIGYDLTFSEQKDEPKIISLK